MRKEERNQRVFISILAGACILVALYALRLCQGSHTHRHHSEEEYDDTPTEGVDFYIVSESLQTMDGRMIPNDAPNVGDTVWIERSVPSQSSHYESDPMWREVQRHVDNDPYFKQW